MQSDYRGYLVKFGDYQVPNSFFNRYASTPDQRIEKKAWRDNREYLQRVTSPNFKTTLKFDVRALNQQEKDLWNGIKQHGMLDETQRKYQVTYWNLDTCEYDTGEFYMPDTEFVLKHIANNNTGEMLYEEFTLEMIEY